MRGLCALLIFFSLSAAQAAEEVVTQDTTAAVTTEATATDANATVEVNAKGDKPGGGIVDNRKEAEIPLNLEAKNKAGSDGSPVFRIILTLAILGVVGTGAFIFLRKYSVPKGMKTATQIKILQQHYLGPKKSLAIVRVAGESILIGITEQNISMIKSLSLLDDEVPEEAPQHFGSVLNTMDDEEEAPVKPSRKVARDLDADEEFAISGIKDIVSKRLKGMRNFQ
jgi:Flagellar biogenesis protein